jgi:DNA-binding NtrC family response regulator
MTTILVVDDDDSLRTSLQELLNSLGYSVDTAEDGSSALERAQEVPYNCALVDLKMPEMDGLEVMTHLHKMNASLPVVIMTGYGTVENAVQAMKQGAADYIVKPFRPDEIQLRIENVLARACLVEENLWLKREITERIEFDNIIGESKQMQNVFALIEKVAPTDSTILIQGESGTGKELIAQAIHYHSLRKEKKFIAVDCGALPETLLESELFGHVKGSFTGAIVTKRGLLEVADGGTFFLDEVGDLSSAIQAKLLRVLQEKEFRPIGGIKNSKVDIRLIAATNKDLARMIKNGEFREDLYYRLKIVPIRLPSLRERRDDIPLLVQHFLKKYNAKRNKEIQGVSREAMNTLFDYDWPGNIRELEHIVERMVIMCDGPIIDKSQIPADLQGKRVCFNISVPQNCKALKQMKKRMRTAAVENIERAFVINALKKSNWNISQAARDVGMKRQNLQALVRKYNIKPV